LLAVERRIKVLERVAADQAVEVSSLAREFGVSEMTIRRDLRRLDRDGFVRRTYGGATTRIVRAAGAFEVTQSARMLHHAQEKRHIALRAAELTDGARVIFVGVGSTVEQFARLAAARDGLLVITPSLVVASLLGTRRVQVIMAGGMVRQDELSCVGPAAVETVQRYNTDIAVIGAAGISARRGVTDLDDSEAGVIRAALERTERIVVLADGSKFGDVALSTVVPIKRVSTIVTDASADPVEVDRIEREGVQVIIAGPADLAAPADVAEPADVAVPAGVAEPADVPVPAGVAVPAAVAAR
jgi:DeoR/GlpR family transcriptional regulator of sugar metabolism